MGLRKTIKAVLTGDIVNSTRIPALKEKILLKELGAELSDHATSFYRGDSFQVFMKEPEDALRMALICRTMAIGLMGDGEVPTDIRISIGLGQVELPVKMPAVARGEAFVLSGHGLDELQHTAQRLLIRSGHVIADIGFQVMSDYLDSIYDQMTPKQAEVIFYLLRGQTQQETAIRQKKSKSTISQLVNSGRWPEIERLLQQYEMLIKQLL
jgi:hypothetical protein